MNNFITSYFDKILSKIFNFPVNSSIIILNGGIGNQLFQYFLGEELRNISKKNVFFYDIRKSYRVNHKSYIENLFKIKLKRLKPSKRNYLFFYVYLSPSFLKFNKLFFKLFSFKLLPNF